MSTIDLSNSVDLSTIDLSTVDLSTVNLSTIDLLTCRPSLTFVNLLTC
jgi:uncharacterized protein YjbI with pentapeptide repeats